MDFEEFRRLMKEGAESRKKDRENDLKRYNAIMDRLEAPDPPTPDEVKGGVADFGEFMEEMYELPESDVGFRNAVNEWYSAWSAKGNADHGDRKYYRDELPFTDGKTEQEFKERCVYPKETGDLKVGDGCYKKVFRAYRGYAKPYYKDTVEHVAQNVRGEIPLYRFMDVEDAESFVRGLEEGKSKVGRYWSWDLSKHRNISGANARYDAARDAVKQKYGEKIEDYSRRYAEYLRRWDYVFFKGRVADAKGVDYHGSVSSNMGGLDHAEVRLKPDAEVLIEEICVSHDYPEGLDAVVGGGAGCVKMKRPLRVKAGSRDEFGSARKNI